jgi:hypothetical protein
LEYFEKNTDLYIPDTRSKISDFPFGEFSFLGSVRFCGFRKKKGDLFQIYIKAFGGIGKIRSVPPER